MNRYVHTFLFNRLRHAFCGCLALFSYLVTASAYSPYTGTNYGGMIADLGLIPSWVNQGEPSPAGFRGVYGGSGGALAPSVYYGSGTNAGNYFISYTNLPQTYDAGITFTPLVTNTSYVPASFYSDGGAGQGGKDGFPMPAFYSSPIFNQAALFNTGNATSDANQTGANYVQTYLANFIRRIVPFDRHNVLTNILTTSGGCIFVITLSSSLIWSNLYMAEPGVANNQAAMLVQVAQDTNPPVTWYPIYQFSAIQHFTNDFDGRPVLYADNLYDASQSYEFTNNNPSASNYLASTFCQFAIQVPYPFETNFLNTIAIQCATFNYDYTSETNTLILQPDFGDYFIARPSYYYTAGNFGTPANWKQFPDWFMAFIYSSQLPFWGTNTYD